MNKDNIKRILERISNVHISVYGDFCIDAYWFLDPNGSEISVETGLKGDAVARQAYSLGGAANTVANLAALKPASISTIGVIGDDIFGHEMIRQFNALGVNTDELNVQKNNYDTVTFGKRFINGQEQPRLDFGFYNKRSRESDKKILKSIRNAIQSEDAVILNQQVPDSIPDLTFIDRINGFIEEFPESTVLLDSRDYGTQFNRVILKINEVECARMNGLKAKPGDTFDLTMVKDLASKLHVKTGKPVFVTRGPHGILAIDTNGCNEIAGINLSGELDTVGAGDTTISALALAMAAKTPPAEAAEFANLAAGVTVQKLHTTGTASGEEILHLFENAL